MTHQLVLLRHGESDWNKANRFTGWTDVDLSAHGIEEAHRADQSLRDAGLTFDVAYTSVLKRAIRTLWIVLDDLDLMWLPVERDWRLNERHYGALQGLNKVETAERLGKDQVFAWRRSFAIRPPALDPDDPRHPRFDPRYAHLDPAQLPACESLQDTLARVLPAWEQVIVPRVRAGERVLIAAHGNSLRALVTYLDRIPEADVPALNIPSGVPRVYTLDDDLGVVESHYLERAPQPDRA